MGKILYLTSPTNKEINALVAEYVAGFTWYKSFNGKGKFLMPPNGNNDTMMNSGPYAGSTLKPCLDYDRLVPNYSNDEKEVIKLLSKFPNVTINLHPDNHIKIYNKYPHMSSSIVIGEAVSSNFCYSACIAMLKTKDIEFQ